MAASSDLTTMVISSEEMTSLVPETSSAGPKPPPMSSLAYTIIGIVMMCYCCLGFTFNSCSILVFAKNKNLRSPTNMFILALNICDFLMASAAAPFSAFSSLSHGWMFGEIGCLYEGFMVYFLGQTSMYLLAAISFDRYFVIAKPLQASKITHRIAGISVGICWFLGFLWSALPAVGWNRYALEGAEISCSVVWQSDNPSDMSYIFVIFFACLVVPLGVMFFSYFNVYMTIKSINKNQVWDMKSRVARRNLRIEKKMFKTILVMCAAFVGAWTPYTAVSFYAAFGGAHAISPLVGTLPALLAKCAGLLNPIIYVATNKQFRTAFYQLVPCDGVKKTLQKKEDEPDSDDSGDENETKTKKDSKDNKDNKATTSKKGGGGNAVGPAPEVIDEKEAETQIEEIIHTPNHTANTNVIKVERVEMTELTKVD
ncbi:parapinopsin [Patella vulgata]|uniref:parapinopsin n=1 Tax=Patella vulgata TaxID=6465 RepID=UPI00218001B9|nr:parapinopsin [Patella vulgata]